MTLAAIHQVVPTVARGDATSAHVLQVRHVLRDLGFRSEIYTEWPCADGTLGIRMAEERVARTDEGVIYQFAIGSVLTGPLIDGPSPLAVNFHNVTPPEMMRRWEPGLAGGLQWGLDQLRQLAPAARLGIAVSRFNEEGLREAGFAETVVAPFLFDVSTFDVPADPAVVDRWSGRDGTDWLFVGRLAPNKAQHDLVRAFALYREAYDPRARLRLVGGSSSDGYRTAVTALVDDLGLSDAVELTGPVSAEALAAHYASADVFVCLSDHEGFCVPLLEAMHHGLPIVAFGSSAVPETLGAGGMCLPEKSPTLVAAAVWRAVSDPSVRDALVAAGHRRLADFDLDRTRTQFAAAVERFVQMVVDD